MKTFQTKTFQTDLGNYYGYVSVVVNKDNSCKLVLSDWEDENSVSISKKLAYNIVKELCNKKIKVKDMFSYGW